MSDELLNLVLGLEDDGSISGTEALVLMVMAWRCFDHEGTDNRKSQGWLAQQCKLRREVVNRALRRLVKKGILRIEGRRYRRMEVRCGETVRRVRVRDYEIARDYLEAHQHRNPWEQSSVTRDSNQGVTVTRGHKKETLPVNGSHK